MVREGSTYVSIISPFLQKSQDCPEGQDETRRDKTSDSSACDAHVYAPSGTGNLAALVSQRACPLKRDRSQAGAEYINEPRTAARIAIENSNQLITRRKSRFAFVRQGVIISLLLIINCVFLAVTMPHTWLLAITILARGTRGGLGTASPHNMTVFHDGLSEQTCTPPGYETPVQIAHAGGADNGKTYLNSLGAMETNYVRGFRLFELDIQMTLDGKPVVTHDRTVRAQMHAEIAHLHLPNITQLVQFASNHSDAAIILDLKNRVDEILNTTANIIIEIGGATVKKQFIPQIYELDDVGFVLQAGVFDTVLFANWKFNLEFEIFTDVITYVRQLTELRLHGVTLWDSNSTQFRTHRELMQQKYAWLHVQNITRLVHGTAVEDLPLRLCEGFGVFSDKEGLITPTCEPCPNSPPTPGSGTSANATATGTSSPMLPVDDESSTTRYTVLMIFFVVSIALFYEI